MRPSLGLDQGSLAELMNPGPGERQDRSARIGRLNLVEYIVGRP